MTRAQRITAARYLRLLASVENLAVLRMDDELRRAVDAVDPIEARELAEALDAENETLPRAFRVVGHLTRAS